MILNLGRYVPVAIPDDDNKKTRKLAKKLSCSRCGKTFAVNKFVLSLTNSRVVLTFKISKVDISQ
jgi:hypothetical protein